MYLVSVLESSSTLSTVLSSRTDQAVNVSSDCSLYTRVMIGAAVLSHVLSSGYRSIHNMVIYYVPYVGLIDGGM